MNKNQTVKNTTESTSTPDKTRVSRARRFSVAPMMDWTDYKNKYISIKYIENFIKPNKSFIRTANAFVIENNVQKYTEIEGLALKISTS